ncbi:unnamed protein product [Paramecium sonneborni]|uniref:F-box protein n=1 Tax=Paramecium sonneborni TaxID=65129 RepID=A0A8S1PTI6_9CILI|nr:unnamed protein product [Paramecium sonneborni]
MNLDITNFQHQLSELNEKQQKKQKDIKLAFDLFQNLVKQVQSLKLPKKNQQSTQNKKQSQNKIKIENQKQVYQEKNLFKRYLSQIVFRNIMLFLTTQDIKQLRLTSYFTNYLIETNLEFIFYKKIQRTIYLESLNIMNFQQPEIPGLKNIQKSLKKLISQNGQIHKIPQQLLSYFAIIIDLSESSKGLVSKRNTYFSKFDILSSTYQFLQYQSLNWYGLYEKDKRALKILISKNYKRKELINGKEYDDLKKYMQNLFDFLSRPDYKIICEAYNKDQLIQQTSIQQRFIKNLLIKIKQKQNYLSKISSLGNLFFKITLSYCSMKDIINSRFVCNKFNQEFKQNSSYHYQISYSRIQKQINVIQTNFNLNLTQDEFLYKTQEQFSLMELFYSIQQNDSIKNNITTKDLLQINSENIAEFIFKSPIQNELYLKCQELIIERLGMDILVEKNYEIFLKRLIKVKECLSDYYIQLPNLQKQLLNIENNFNFHEF